VKKLFDDSYYLFNDYKYQLWFKKYFFMFIYILLANLLPNANPTLDAKDCSGVK
jgi:hypothetical protein